jgi:hypothetical protein
MFDRIMGIVTLKAPTYKAVAHDEKATREAMMIVIIVSLIQGFVIGLILPEGGVSITAALMRAVVNLGVGLLSWYVVAWLLAAIAKAFGGKTDINEMLRVTGYVAIFNLAVLLNLAGLIATALLCITSIIGLVILVLSIIGYVIGVREAAEFSTGNAVITAVLAAIANFVISLIGGVIAGLFV